ncbi:oxidoreductase, NAD-binding domain protein [Capnocytophaga sp. oral taxon 863 str. F0517]|uniref:Gfo/Idh/MocA family oxidoreductase n=1 Tax=Capnocytophaga sp. oral taxon 863 TaxID=1227265 RepID=UPI0003960957|nr:Gfo/Idh/MocA family oxidoreductase [Capnocytophaga sp. oral taxon 863]ERI64779.1 oxidoreductase, NAD-binding domain protein [Capnocytophaga sp. oral taxon 863 str. F0517]
MKNKLKVGVLGAGHLGKIHLKLLNQSERYELVGFYDPNQEQAQKVVAEFGYTYFDSIDKLIAAVEVVDIVTPTLSHYECAMKAIAAKRHIFIEKPITNTVEEAEEIYRLLEANHLKGQVGHVERFNPAFVAAKPAIKNPMFIEVHRLAEFNPRGTDVSVVLDLMIHDIDVLLSVVHSPVKQVEASGVAVISKSPDITNARIEFENGCVANLTASRISMKNMRKSRFFQRDAYISVDFLEKKVEVIHMKDAPENPGEYDMILQNAEGDRKQIYFEHPEVLPTNAILNELETFADAIEHNTTPVVTFQQGTEALRLAKQISALAHLSIN